MPGDGTFIVKTDINPGTYATKGGDGCYYARLSGFGGTADEILANDNVSGPTVVTIKPTDKGFKTSNCGEWTSGAKSPAAGSGSKPQTSGQVISDGTYLVGKTIEPGTYRNGTGTKGCYWERLSGTTSTTDDIIANENANGPAVVTVAKSDTAFKSQRCGEWSTKLTPVTPNRTTMDGDGTFIVGTDIRPGTYSTKGGDGCYYARLSGFGGTTDDILANDNVSGPTVVTIKSTDKGFQTSRCGKWTA